MTEVMDTDNRKPCRLCGTFEFAIHGSRGKWAVIAKDEPCIGMVFLILYQEVTQKAWDRDRSVASFIFWCGDIPALALTLACDALINFKCGREGVKIFPKQRRAFSPTHSRGIQG